MLSLCDSHGWASGEWLAINVLINGRHTLERLSPCDAWSTVAAAIVVMDWLGGRSQGAVKKKGRLITGSSLGPGCVLGF